MKVKKLLSMILIGTAAVGLLAGCGSSAGNGQDTRREMPPGARPRSCIYDEAEETADNTADTSDTADGSGNVLVVYYSATGNTEP